MQKMIMDSLNGKKKKDFHYSSDEEEVLAFDDSDASDDSEDKGGNFDDDEDIDEDELEGENGEDMEEDETRVDSSWGRKKSAYYSGNRIQNEDDALLEEEEANLLQKKMLKDLDTNDFGLDAFQINKSFKILKTSEQLSAEKLAEDTLGEKSSFKQLDDESIEKVIKNLSKMSKKERLDFLKQESPELFELVRDFKEKVFVYFLF
jgi:U3 small nucleolar RNA-associated protein 3